MWHKWSSNHPPHPLMSVGIGADLISVVGSYIRRLFLEFRDVFYKRITFAYKGTRQ